MVKSIVRAAVLVMVVAGAISGLALSRNVPAPVSHQVASTAVPTPMCPLDDPDACGFK